MGPSRSCAMTSRGPSKTKKDSFVRAACHLPPSCVNGDFLRISCHERAAPHLSLEMLHEDLMEARCI